jgi:hypothetical protein
MAHSGLNLFNPLDFQLKLPSSIAFLAFWLSSGITPPSNLSLYYCTM